MEAEDDVNKGMQTTRTRRCTSTGAMLRAGKLSEGGTDGEEEGKRGKNPGPNGNENPRGEDEGGRDEVPSGEKEGRAQSSRYVLYG